MSMTQKQVQALSAEQVISLARNAYTASLLTMLAEDVRFMSRKEKAVREFFQAGHQAALADFDAQISKVSSQDMPAVAEYYHTQASQRADRNHYRNDIYTHAAALVA